MGGWMDGENKRVSPSLSHWEALNLAARFGFRLLICCAEGSYSGFIPREQKEAIWPWVYHL